MSGQVEQAKEPDCLFPEEVQALIRSLKRINKYNKEKKRYGLSSPLAFQVIQDEANHWIKLLDVNGVVMKRRT